MGARDEIIGFFGMIFVTIGLYWMGKKLGKGE
jgi:hypothetical protein